MHTLQEIRRFVVSTVPDDATAESVWVAFGWDKVASKNYMVAKKAGVDLRVILAPMLASLVAHKMPWEQLVIGNDLRFQDDTPKGRLLSAIDFLSVKPCLH